MCVCVLKRQIDGCGGSESGGETLILIMNQIFYSKKKKKNYESNLKVSVFLLNPHFKTLFF